MEMRKFSQCLLMFSAVGIYLTGCGTINSENSYPEREAPKKPDIIKKNPIKGIVDDLPEKPENGERAFFGVKVKDCPDKNGVIGTYVVGFYTIRNESPARRAGIMLGDRIERINDRVNITAEGIEKYIASVATDVPFKWYFSRGDKRFVATVNSKERILKSDKTISSDSAGCDVVK